MTIQVTIDGLDQFLAAVRKAPATVIKEISTASQKSVLTIQSNAMKEAPVNKSYGGGNLRQNIKSRMIGKFGGEIVANAPYSAAVELGTRPHIIRPVNARVLANKRTGQFFGKLVHHPGTKPNPFMLRAVQGSAKKIEEFFNTALSNTMKGLLQ